MHLRSCLTVCYTLVLCVLLILLVKSISLQANALVHVLSGQVLLMHLHMHCAWHTVKGYCIVFQADLAGTGTCAL